MRRLPGATREIFFTGRIAVFDQRICLLLVDNYGSHPLNGVQIAIAIEYFFYRYLHIKLIDLILQVIKDFTALRLGINDLRRVLRGFW